ncbi:BrnT family toxin [Roseomonas gilardii]|uniref:BrnT family toxin n=1 Tax=Roseomonas gilardii TaxID=257708 RepID=A0ABU3MBC0_9PROT|nr:BrnT family toxin [Roseomonas gilardii]MDT8330189.1 BrnT family toxin [Roseomonas gilardii]
MPITWDEAKAASNLAKHGVAFEAVFEFDWETALVRADVRFAYSEPRLIAFGVIGDRLHALVFTVERRSLRVISLRKANSKEFDRYVAEA